MERLQVYFTGFGKKNRIDSPSLCHNIYKKAVDNFGYIIRFMFHYFLCINTTIINCVIAAKNPFSKQDDCLQEDVDHNYF